MVHKDTMVSTLSKSLGSWKQILRSRTTWAQGLRSILWGPWGDSRVHRYQNIGNLQHQHGNGLAELLVWLKVNKLSLNIKKTNFMIFTRNKHINGEIDIKTDNQAITETKSDKFLGVYIDNNLNWKMHINYIAGRLSRGIGILYKAKKFQRWMSLTIVLLVYIPSFDIL